MFQTEMCDKTTISELGLNAFKCIPGLNQAKLGSFGRLIVCLAASSARQWASPARPATVNCIIVGTTSHDHVIGHVTRPGDTVDQSETAAGS